MKTKPLLHALCAAAYPLVSLAATLATALCVSTPVQASSFFAPRGSPSVSADGRVTFICWHK